ncbi:MAG: hypothetical protein U0794_01080 [Isosphaeraceae bacterium]
MPESPRPLPPATLRKLVPPSIDHHYFHRFEEHPFEAESKAFSVSNAWWLAELSMLSYGDETLIRKVLEETGVRSALQCELRVIDGATRGARAILLEARDWAVVVFRGTRIESYEDPYFKFRIRLVNGSDFFTDLDLRLDPEWQVHTGFRHAFEEVWPELQTAIESGPGRRGKPIWYAGHSLGAAIATLAASRPQAARLAGLITFGSPRVGSEAFCKTVRLPSWRVVNNADVVPHLPVPSLLAAYAHVGQLKFIDSQGRLHDEPALFDVIEHQLRGHAQAVAAGLGSFRLENLRSVGQVLVDVIRRGEIGAIGSHLESLDLDILPVASVADHMPINYVIRLWNALRRDDPGAKS